ncbi:MAG TPA: antibiotic biosynthesis monooxygenase [Gammaproteobacteria bacterium]|nr:antibiotic biosynthesis monooxygenase [Gammaproteobacteria bacterium]
MFMVANRVYVASGWEEQFEERFRKRAGRIEQQPGFVRMEVLRPVSEDTPYVVNTAWEDEAAFRSWIGSADFKDAHANPLPREAFSAEGKLEQYQTVVSAARSD